MTVTARAASCRLYLISPERMEHPSIFADELRAALDGGDVAAFQLRLKGVDDAAIARCADTLRPICQQRSVAFFLNDRPDLAVKLYCDGVHIGQDDMPYREARRITGPDRQIGVTCKASRHLAMEAAEAGADYVAFGAFFASTTKAVTTPASLEIIEWYLFFIDAKLQRALQGKLDGLEEEYEFPKDSDGSAKVAIIAIERSMNAWMKLYELMSSSEDVALTSLSILSRLKQLALEEFPNAMLFKRPGFDDQVTLSAL